MAVMERSADTYARLQHQLDLTTVTGITTTKAYKKMRNKRSFRIKHARPL